MSRRHRFLILPSPDRPLPHRWTDWLRLAIVVVLLAAGIPGVPFVVNRLGCFGGVFPSADIWRVEGECVGLSDDAYAFDRAEFAAVMSVIKSQNDAAAGKCAPQGSEVVVGVLLTMTDRFSGVRAVHELEGMAAGQRQANGTGCLHPMRLVVGQVGAYGDGNASAEVAARLARYDKVVAVAGIGLSNQRAAEVADLLAAAKIPMVSDLITAEGFDQHGSREDEPDFTGCDPGSYQRGVGKDYFYRVAYRSAAQVKRLKEVTDGQPDFIMVPTGGSDPYTCTTLPLVQRAFGGKVTEVKFDTDEPSTVPQTAKRVCAAAKDVRVVYVARGRDLGRLLYNLDEAQRNGQCAATSITVLSTSDGQRIRVAETDPVLEDFRVKALRSGTFASGRLRLLTTLVGGADRARADTPNFAAFEQAFTSAGFDPSHIDNGWPVNAYDALTTIAEALRTLPATAPVRPSEVNTAIGGFSSSGQSVPGAGGPITFDNAGNRTDAGPPVVRVCPLPEASGATPARTISALLPADCPR
ncbi:ABC transporter substrate-binding protein [Amycolatopsis sp. cg5]|uniref:ABC transporter substrate-binding protein n=1 Tax=Amycolatopsis sp. cg5 TaxID=3238802 RepID=UPI0035238F4E